MRFQRRYSPFWLVDADFGDSASLAGFSGKFGQTPSVHLDLIDVLKEGGTFFFNRLLFRKLSGAVQIL